MNGFIAFKSHFLSISLSTSSHITPLQPVRVSESRMSSDLRVRRMRCAFCEPFLSYSTFNTGRSPPLTTSALRVSSFRTTTYQVARNYRSWHRQQVIQPKKRARGGTGNPQCTFGNNSGGSNDKFMTQVADTLIAASRFFQSTTGQIVLWGGLVWLVLTGKIGFLFDSFIFLFVLATTVPVIAMVAFRWWIGRQLVQGTCPFCGAPVAGLRNQPIRCMSCGNTVQSEDKGDFSAKDASSATIDIDAKEIPDK